MEQIIYRKTLDVHKNGSQFLLQGFETADNLSRVIEISLMASGDAIDFPLERIVAMMYVTTPGASEPSINQCTIEDNKVVYNVLPIVEEGITTMQLKLIETSPEGAKRVLASPKFTVEVTKSNVDDDGEEQKTTFTALEDAIAKSNAVYNSRLIRIEIDDNCGFKAYYNDGTIYYSDEITKKILSVTTDMDLTELVKSGLVSFTADEVSEKVLNDISEDIDFKMGQAKYLSDLLVNFEKPTFVMWDALTNNTPFIAELTNSSEGFAFVFGDIEANHSIIAFVKGADKHTYFVHSIVNGEDKGWSDKIDLSSEVKGILPVEHGGTGAKTSEEAFISLGIDKYQKPWNVESNIVKININDATASVSSSSASDFGEAVHLFPMINSGKAYLKYNLACTNTARNCEMQIYLNDTLISSHNHTDIDGKNKYTVLLDNIKKGDNLKFHLKCKSWSDGQYASCEANNISLYANAETPYKYINLDLKTDSITATDILNALTGGTD